MNRSYMVEETAPVGEVYEIDQIETRLQALAVEWDQELEGESHSWWKACRWGSKVNMVKVTNFLIHALDELIHIVDNILDNGPDKKATVLDAIDRLYEYVIKEALPIWLKPFAGRVKQYIIYTLVSTAIDWIVNKYRQGEWRDKIEDIAHGGDENVETNEEGL